MTIKAGSFVKAPHGDPNVGAIRVGLVAEVSTNEYSDGTSESFAQVAWLPLEHVPLESLTEFVSGGSAPVPPANPGRTVVGSSVDAGTTVGAVDAGTTVGAVDAGTTVGA